MDGLSSSSQPQFNQEIHTQPSYSRWLTEEVFNLIDMVRNDEAIYNPRHKYYFCRPYVENFWREIDIRLRKNSGASLAKWTNLRISFRREYANFQEEKVPPCWSYFDRMLFLHPYLRNKKHDVPKVIDSHLQEALAQISNLNYKSQHQSATTGKTAKTTTATTSDDSDYVVQYLSYCEDDPQPQSPDEGLDDDLLEDEQQPVNSNAMALDTKPDNELIDNEEKETIQQIHEEQHDFKDIIIEINDDETSNNSQSDALECDNLNRSLLKRPRTELNVATPSNTNVSLVRPLTSFPSSGETNVFQQSALQAGGSINNPSNRSIDLGSPSSAFASSSSSLAAVSMAPVMMSSAPAPAPPISTVTTASASRRKELCECKTDSDAMFLMSLLPDIRKLNGRDRGRIKIAFQNIVQEFLYPD